MNIKTKINYYVTLTEKDGGNRKYRKATKTVQLWLQEVAPDQLIPAFVVGSNIFYWYQEKLWREIEHNSTGETAVEAFCAGCAKGKLAKPESPVDTFSVMYERASSLVSKRLACNGEMYVVTGEPHYCLRYNQIWTQSNGKLNAFVSFHDDESQSALERSALRFNALEWDLMQKYIRITKAVMRDNITVEVRDQIQVLLPEAVKIHPAEDLTKTKGESGKSQRIICDSYRKGNITPFKGKYFANREFTALNNLYGWLYKEGILMQHAFVARDYTSFLHFGIDAKELEPYRTAMVSSGIPDADLAVEILLDREITPCMYTGAITLSSPMSTFRETDDVVSKSWECGMMQFFGSEGANEILEVSQCDGAKSAVMTMFERIPWKQGYISVNDTDKQKL